MNSKSTKLTPNQQAIWLEAKLHENKPIFNIGTYAQINGILDKEILEKSIQCVISDNDALRLRIGAFSIKAEQFFDDQRDFNLETVMFNSVESATKWMNEDFTSSIEINDNPLYSISLVIAGSHSFLYFKHHHIFIDGWSRALLLQKIAQNYNAILSSTVVDTKSSFKSYVESIVNSRNDLDQSLEFWEKEFSDVDRLSTFSKKNASLQFAPSKRKRFIFSKDRFDKIKFDGKQDSKAKFYFLLASLYVTLSRSTGNEEITIGVPLLNRFSETEKLTIGYFVGLIPLRLKFSSNASFSEIVSGIQSKMRSTVSYRNVAIHEINKSVGVNFSNSTQLFDVVFSFEPHNHDCKFGELEVIHSGTFSSDFEQNPLVIHVQDFNKKDAVNFEFDHNLNYLDDTEVEEFIQRFDQAVSSFSLNPETRLSDVSILLPIEQDLLREFGTGIQEEPTRLSLIEQIELKAKQYPDRTILRDESASVTYIELINQARQIAGNLISKGIQPGECVGIIVPRNINTVISVVGVLMSGARYVPIDPEIPDDRLNYMIEIANIKVLVYDSRVTRRLSSSQLENLDLAHLKVISDFDLPKVPFNHPAYIIFTSGTTGKPKGVCINQDSVSNLIQFLKGEVYAPYGEHLKLAHISSFNFDQSGQHMFASLILGHELVIFPEDARIDGKLLLKYLTDFQIDVCDGIPTQLSSMLMREPKMPENFNVKHFIIGGEAFTTELARLLFKWSNGRGLGVTNAYGPTESTVFSMHYTFNASNYEQFHDIAIGAPIRNTTIWILDKNGLLLPPGVKGELCIGGAGVATGYINQDNLTKDKFKYNENLKERLYHTGDVAHWNENGELFYHGRSDNQVKIKGYRVELSEIEYWLNQIDFVEQSIALIKNQGKQKKIIGYVQSKREIKESEIKNELSRYLPSYMIPHSIEFMKAFPLTVTGKIDRNLLLLSETIGNEVEHYPQTETERILAGIMSEVLELETIDAEASFFLQGGDSLGLVFLLVKIEEAFNISISMSDFGSMNSVRNIAKFIDSEVKINDLTISLEEELYDLNVLSNDESSVKTEKEFKAFITGGTGFVGAFLIDESLRKFDSVICLVRADSHQMAKQKLKETFAQYHLNRIDWNRIEIVVGDLSKDMLGLSIENWKAVSEVDHIYHCGAMVNFMKDFETLKISNVFSTYNMLKLCRVGNRKVFNFVSTKGVFSGESKKCLENDSLEGEIHYNKDGYESTKWLADVLTSRARSFGISCNIFRLGRITGESQMGISRYDDFFHRFIEGCIQVNCFPEDLLELPTDLTPVDISAQAIIRLSLKMETSNYHISNNNLVPYKDIIKECENEGEPMGTEPYEEWLAKVEALNRMDQNNPFFLITPILKQKAWFNVQSNILDSNFTVDKMNEEGLQWINGETLLKIYIANSVQRVRSKLNSI